MFKVARRQCWKNKIGIILATGEHLSRNEIKNMEKCARQREPGPRKKRDGESDKVEEKRFSVAN